MYFPQKLFWKIYGLNNSNTELSNCNSVIHWWFHVVYFNRNIVPTGKKIQTLYNFKIMYIRFSYLCINVLTWTFICFYICEISVWSGLFKNSQCLVVHIFMSPVSSWKFINIYSRMILFSFNIFNIFFYEVVNW